MDLIGGGSGGQLLRLGLGPAQHGFDAIDEHLHAEGLGHVIVRALSEPGDDVLILGAGREHHDGDLGKGAQRGEHLEAVHVWDVDVQNDKVETLSTNQPQGIASGVCHPHLEALPRERIAQEVGQVLIVVDAQNLGHR